MLNSRIKAIIAVFFVVVVMGFNVPAKAERVQNLYTGAWPVQDQSSAARHQAIAESLLQALVRASGSRDVSYDSDLCL